MAPRSWHAFVCNAGRGLPPIDAVFVQGSKAVGDWLDLLGWNRAWGYNSNFKDAAVADAYERIHQAEHPMYASPDAYAILGGWHLPWPDDDWHDLLDDELLVMTLRGSEPWIEAWRSGRGEFKVIKRIT